jgi:hypothetical protein
MTTAPLAAPPTSGAALAAQYRIELEPGIPLLNENQSRRMHWRRKGELAAAIRQAGVDAGRKARLAGLPTMERVHVFYIVHPGPRVVRRDPANWAQSAKAAIDGALVDAGILPDDDSTRLLGGDPRLGPSVAGTQLVLVVTDLTGAPPWLLSVLDPTSQISKEATP